MSRDSTGRVTPQSSPRTESIDRCDIASLGGTPVVVLLLLAFAVWFLGANVAFALG